jgi:FkbM family methyltransferase
MAVHVSTPRQWLCVRVPDGGIFVPPSVQYLSTYVLLEQEDWFEKEIRFVRTLLLPGMRAIDVGANFGLYTLALARAVGRGGAVWAFEPAELTLALLRQTVAANALSQVVVCPLALSDHAGSGFLGVQPNSELNSLVAAPAPTAQPVRLATLEEQHSTLGMGAVDFIKLDAEGEEVRIIAGSRRFFAAQSPLVMFEVKAGAEINAGLPEILRELGYQVYRLVGPDTLLVPVAPGEPLDAFELNLFACKPERAAELARRGLLVERTEPAPACAAGAGERYWWAQPFASGWRTAALAVDAGAAWADRYAYWRDTSNPPAARFAALLAAVAELRTATAARPTLNALATLARLLLESGARAEAVRSLAEFLQRAQAGAGMDAGLVWPPSAGFDAVRPAGAPLEWLIAAAIRAYVEQSSFSDYFSTAPTLPMLDWLQATPYRSAPMERRRHLQATRAGRPAGAATSGLPRTAGPEHLNAALWNTGLEATAPAAAAR